MARQEEGSIPREKQGRRNPPSRTEGIKVARGDWILVDSLEGQDLNTE